MDIQFTKHAKERMRERGLTEKVIKDAFSHPHILHASTKKGGRFIIKQLISRVGKKHLLMIIFEKSGNNILVITMIDTSKVQKYY